MPNQAEPRRSVHANALGNSPSSAAGAGHLGGYQRPPVQGPEAGHDGQRRDQLAGPGAVGEDRLERGHERSAVVDQGVVRDQARHHSRHGQVQDGARSGAQQGGPAHVPLRVTAGIKVKELTADQFDDWLDERAEELSTRTLRLIHQILERAIRQAQARDRSAATWRAWSMCPRVRKVGRRER
jgi:hypothetical protein